MHNEISDIIKEMVFYFDGDVKRVNHALKVYGFAKTIGELNGIQEEKLKVLEVVAILHDIGIKESEKKYGSSSGKYQETEGPPVARDLLQKYGLSKEFIDRVCYIIGHHHSYGKIDDLDFQILVEADFLVNIGEDEMGQKEIETIRQKYFKTHIGTSLLNCLYGTKLTNCNLNDLAID